MLDQIRQSLAQFTPAERKIAEAILETPSTAITWSITDAARIARVSEPSIVRFCRRLDCDGFPDFRMKLAQQLAIRQAPSPVSDNGTDPLPLSSTMSLLGLWHHLERRGMILTYILFTQLLIISPMLDE